MGGDSQRVVIVFAGEDAVARPELVRLLEAAAELEVVSRAGDAGAAVEAVVRHAAAVLVLDLDRPGDIASLDTIRAVGEASPATAVVVLGTQGDALHAGAVACIVDDDPGEDLLEAVRRAATRPPADGAADRGPPPDDLTEREFQVLRLLALGHTNAEVAAQLHLSVRTVEAHRAHLQRKLSRPSRAELVRYALERGLLQAPEEGAHGSSGPGQPPVSESDEF